MTESRLPSGRHPRRWSYTALIQEELHELSGFGNKAHKVGREKWQGVLGKGLYSLGFSRGIGLIEQIYMLLKFVIGLIIKKFWHPEG